MCLDTNQNKINNEIYNTIFNNSLLFLNKSIELVLQYHSTSEIEKEDAVILCLYTQFAIELATKASIVYRFDVTKILDTSKHKNDNLNQIYNKFKNNTIHTKKFEILKQYIISNKDTFNIKDFDFKYVDNFQRLRNKIVHINYNFSKHELETLISSIIYVLTRFVVKLLGSSYDQISYFLSHHIEESKFLKLLKYKPYINEIKKISSQNRTSLMNCPYCGENLYDYRERECLLCLTSMDSQVLGLIDCYYCHSSECVIFDKLNLHCNNNFAQGICQVCGEEITIYVCPTCGIEDTFDFPTEDYGCRPNFCGFYQTSTK